MTTAAKLWLGFGTVTVMLVLSTAAIISNISQIDGQVREMADARNLSDAVAQIEIDTLGYALGVRTYLQTRDPAALKRAADSAAAVDRHLRSYERLVASDRRRQMAARFAPRWQELRTLGEALVDPESAPLTLDHSKRFFELRARLESVLSDEMQADALATYNERKDRALWSAGAVVQFALFMLAGGAVTALLTSVGVGRGVIRAEQRLQANRELLRVTLASIGDAVITTDTNGRVSYLNAVAEALTGWSREQACGQPLDTVFRIVDQRTRRPLERPASEAWGEGAVKGRSSHAVLVARDGVERPIDDNASPIRNEDGRFAGVVLTFRDVTERTRLESELRRIADELIEADKRKNEFLAMLAHELRSPLAPISNALQALRRSRPDAGDQPATRMMERQLDQMVRLVDDLLDVSRITRGKIELRRMPVELVSATNDAAEAIRPFCESMEHRLTVTLPPQPVYVDADPARLAQVIGNLLNNACKFTDRGGRISLAVERDRGDAVISVKDDGIGIAPEQLPHVFELFVQAHSSAGRAESGIGIGLALVKNLVEMHGGAVSGSSAGLGRGSEFVVRLPIIEAPVPARQENRAAAQAGSRRRILVVDDNHDSALSMAALLEIDGHDTRTAADGPEALKIAEAWQPDALVLDIGLPGLSGYEVARQIRGQPWGKRMTLIALTGWGQEEKRRKSYDAGFDGHLVKPANYDSIVALLGPASSQDDEHPGSLPRAGVEAPGR